MRGYRCRLTEGFLGWVFFCVWFNVHTFNRRHRADRRVKGWLRRDGWAEGKGGSMGLGMGGGIDTYILLTASGSRSHSLPR